MKFVYAFLVICCLAGPSAASAQGAPPLNDECADATAVAVPNFNGTNYFAVNTSSATQTFPTPGCSSTSADDDVWYSFVAVSDGLIVRYRNAVLAEDSRGVGYAIYPQCGAFEIACNFNFGDASTGSELVEFFQPLVPGETYLLRIFTEGTNGGGAFEFGLQAYEQNDDCLGAREIVVQPPGACAFTNISTQNFSRTFIPPSACARTSNNDDGWYSFQATSEFIVINYENLVATSGSSTGLGFSLHDGCSGAELACDFSIGGGGAGSEVANPLSPLNPGQTYILRLYLEGPASSGTFDFCLQESVCRPPFVRYQVIFDDCENGGPKVVTNVFDLGSGDSLLVVNEGSSDTLVFKTTGRDTTAAFATEGTYRFTAVNQQSSDCNQEATVNVYCPAPNQSCISSIPLLINGAGSCDLLNEANNWYSATSEYPLDPSCGFYRGGDLFFTFTAPTPTLIFEILENPFSTLALSANELNCEEGGLEVDCQTITGAGTRTLTGFTIGEQYSLRVYDRSDNDFGTAVFCVQSDISLPAELGSFTGSALPKLNEIRWMTSSEENVDRFELQKQGSAGGWSVIASLPATNQASGSAYTLTDANPAASEFYRLRTVDFDGSSALSEIINVTRAAGFAVNDVRLYPNPARDFVTLSFPGAQFHSLELIENSGRVIRRAAISDREDYYIELSDLTPSVYTVRLFGDQGSLVRRFIHQ